MGEVWPTAHVTELCLQLTAGSGFYKRRQTLTLGSQNCERALLIIWVIYLTSAYTFINFIKQHCNKCYRSVVCTSVCVHVTLVNFAKAVGRNEMPFGSDTCVTAGTLYWTEAPVFPKK